LAHTFKLKVEPADRTIEVAPDETILSACQRSGLEIEALCGGSGKCGKCAVKVTDGNIKPSPKDLKILSRKKLREGWRLACQSKLEGDTSIYLPAISPKMIEPEMLTDFDLTLKKAPVVAIELSQLETDLKYSSHAENIKAALAKTGVNVAGESVKALRNLGQVADIKSPVRCYLFQDKLLDVKPAAESENLALALDIGTTTLSMALVDASSKRILNIASQRNPQYILGADVISRISSASSSPENHQRLHSLVIKATADMARRMVRELNLNLSDINLLTVVGNPTMHHLFLGLEVASLGRFPFRMAVSEEFTCTAAELGLPLKPACPVIFLPLIASYVGSDAIGMTLALSLADKRGDYLAVDVGTNGEMILNRDGQLYSCSTAAGPAFEGAGIECGMVAAEGAITGVSITREEGVMLEVKGGVPPQGIAGSGLLDIVSELLRWGVIDSSGRMIKNSSWPAFLQDRANHKYGKHYFQLDRQNDVFLSQADIREVQLAKGAIRTGIEVLIRSAGIEPDKLDGLFIAGAFGSNLKPESLVNIGMIPKLPIELVTPVGNAALTGAILCSLSEEHLAIARQISKSVNHVELSLSPSFNHDFINNTLFQKNSTKEK